MTTTIPQTSVSNPPRSPPLPIDGPRLINIVCGVNLNCLIDLKTVALHARNSYYNPKRFQAVTLRQRDPRATALVFASGKMQVLGCRSISDAHLSARKFARMVQKLGFDGVKLSNFNIQNLVAHADAKCKVRLEGIHLKHRAFARFEPEIFPGLCYKMVRPSVTVLIFANGKMVLLGAKKEEDIHLALKLLYPVLKEFPVREKGPNEA